MSNPIKFGLPAVKGTELWPQQIQAPPVLRVSGVYTGRSSITAYRQNDASYTVLDNNYGIRQYQSSRVVQIKVDNSLIQRAADARLTAESALISNFALSQRRNFSLSPNNFSSTFRDYGNIKLHYTSINNLFEIITAEVAINEQDIVNTAMSESDHKIKQEPGDDTLMCVVFSNGGVITYTRMDDLIDNAENARGEERTLNESEWGSKIIPTCQVMIGPKFSAIYSQMQGFESGSMSYGDRYSITSCKLLEEREVESSPGSGIAPILNGSGMTAYVGGATINFNDDGSINSFSKVDYDKDESDNLMAPWAISPGGDRYSAAQMFGTASVNTGVGVLTSYSENNGGDDSISEYSGFFRHDPNRTVPGDDAFYYRNGSKVSVTPEGGATAQGWNDPPGSNPFYSWANYAANESITINVPAMVQNGAQCEIGSYTFTNSYSYTAEGSQFLTGLNPIAPVVYITVTSSSETYNDSVSFDGESFSESVSYQGWTGTKPYLDDAPVVPWPDQMFHRLWLIPFPYNLPGRPCWKQVTQFLSTFTGSPLDSFKVTYITPYGDSITVPVYGVDIGGFVGWLNISNADHVLQAFALQKNGDKRYMYLNGRKISSLLGVSVGAIQTVLFDVPLRRLNEFN